MTELPIAHWSHSSLTAYLRNPLAWYKRYVENVRDMPQSPSSIVGRAGHKALEHFYGGISKEGAIDLGMEYLRNVPDFEINFGVAKTKKAQKEKRKDMEETYLQAINFYLAKPPKHNVVEVEYMDEVSVPSVAIPLKAVADLVVKSRGNPGMLDIVDHKFVSAFSKDKADKTLFIIQAMFNYYVVSMSLNMPVARFIVYECKITKNRDGRPQLRRYAIDFRKARAEFAFFLQLIEDATNDLATRKVFLPNPSDMFEGENSVDIYRLNIL